MLRGRILVVEDEPAIATVVEETLTAEAYEVVCTSGASALRPIPIVAMIGKDITTEDRQRLYGLVAPVLRTSEYRRDDLLNNVRGLGVPYRRHKAARDTVRANKL